MVGCCKGESLLELLNHMIDGLGSGELAEHISYLAEI